ncbi:MAG TPA: hypothetical protein VIG67_07175 [Yaniella sp.]
MSNPTPDYHNVSSHHQPIETVPPPAQGDPGYGSHLPQQKAGPNNFVLGLNDQVGIISRLSKNQTLEAFQVARRSPLLWVVTLSIGALLIGLLLATTLARMSGAAMSSFTLAFGGGSVYFGMTAGAWFTIVFASIVVVAIVMALRAVALHLTFQLGGKPQAFRESMSVLATAYSLHLPIMVLMLLLVLIPGRSWVMIVGVIGAFLWTVFTLLSELLIYIGLNRTTGFANSPLRAHVIATAIWMIAVAIIYVLVTLIMGDIATNSLGGLL